MRRAGHVRTLIPLVILAVSGLLLTDQLRLSAKARVASHLIDRAFAAHLEDGRIHRPWRWADTHPVALLSVPRLDVRRTVLSGASGSSLAFGPGHVDGSARPNARGNCVLAGHRDSWFAFLFDLRLGDRILLRTREATQRYEVTEIRVVSMWDLEALDASDQGRLTLITCHPFGGLLPSPWRLVVRCAPLPRSFEASNEQTHGTC